MYVHLYQSSFYFSLSIMFFRNMVVYFREQSWISWLFSHR